MAKNDPLGAIAHFEQGMRDNPSLDQTLFGLQMLGMAYFHAGRYETAIALFRERILLVPNTDWSRGFLIAALGQLGRFEEARAVWNDLMRINPKYVLAERLARSPVHVLPQHRATFEGWRKAGLPTGEASG